MPARAGGAQGIREVAAILTEVTLPALEYICLNMRDADRLEIMNVVAHDSPIRLAREAHYMITNMGRGRIAWHNQRPAAVIFLTEDRPTIWQIGMFGTDDTKAVAFSCMRWARENLREIIRPPMCGRRMQCDSRVGHDESWRFLMAMGAVKEGPPMRAYGKDGGDYQRFVWITGENDHVLRGRQQDQQPENTINHVRLCAAE
jgi:hypothetical protein